MFFGKNGGRITGSPYKKGKILMGILNFNGNVFRFQTKKRVMILMGFEWDFHGISWDEGTTYLLGGVTNLPIYGCFMGFNGWLVVTGT